MKLFHNGIIDLWRPTFTYSEFLTFYSLLMIFAGSLFHHSSVQPHQKALWRDSKHIIPPSWHVHCSSPFSWKQDWFSVGNTAFQTDRQTDTDTHTHTHTLTPTRLLCPYNSPGKNTGLGSHSLLQGIFLTQESKLGLPQCRQSVYSLNHQASPTYKGVESTGREETRCPNGQAWKSVSVTKSSGEARVSRGLEGACFFISL